MNLFSDLIKYGIQSELIFDLNYISNVGHELMEHEAIPHLYVHFVDFAQFERYLILGWQKV